MKPSRSHVPVWAGLIAATLGAAPPDDEAPKPVPPPAAESRSATDLATRFQFMERYGTEERSKPEAIGQYRVGSLETIKIEKEQPQGAPSRSEFRVQVIYTERPAQVTAAGEVHATVRHYEAYRMTPDPAARPSAPRPLEGLTLWYQPRGTSGPLIVTLSGGRGLRESDYALAHRQVFVPELAELLPSLPIRVADKWSVSSAGARVLVGDKPGRGEPLTGTLQEVRASAKGSEMEAVIAITGRTPVPGGEVTVNGRLVFSFPMPSPPEGSQAKGRDEGIVAARGAITELRLASVLTHPLGRGNSRLREVSTRELILGRQLANPGAALAIPDPAPTPTEANSWLTYEAPKGEYHFRYSQDFRKSRQEDPYSIILFRPRAGGDPDTVDFRLQIKTGDPEADRLNREPDFLVKTLKEEWKEARFDVLRGPEGWLTDREWEAAGQKVYRIEVALRGGANAGGRPGKKDVRVHTDYYLVLFRRDESLVVTANTIQDPPLAFRKQVEAIIRTFQFGPAPAR